MTKKHFVALAKVLMHQHPSNTGVAHKVYWVALVNGVADVCAEANTNFNWSTFIDACLPDGEEW